jgi:hypothetical protein
MSRKGPSFESWSIENLIKFSSEAYEKLCQQDDYIQQLQCDLKTAIEAYRRLNRDHAIAEVQRLGQEIQPEDL